MSVRRASQGLRRVTIAVMSFLVFIAVTIPLTSFAAAAVPKSVLSLHFVNLHGQPEAERAMVAQATNVIGLEVRNVGPVETRRGSLHFSFALPDSVVPVSTLAYDATTGNRLDVPTTITRAGGSISIATKQALRPLAPNHALIFFLEVEVKTSLGSSLLPSILRTSVRLHGQRVRAHEPMSLVPSPVAHVGLLENQVHQSAPGGIGVALFALKNLSAVSDIVPGATTTATLSHLTDQTAETLVSASGAGWDCRGPPASMSCHYSGPVLASGAISDPLIVRYRVAPSAPANTELNWRGSFSIPTPLSANQAMAFPEHLQLRDSLAQKVAVKVAPLSGQTVSPTHPMTLGVIQKVTVGAAWGMRDKVVLPPGLTMDAVSNHGWSCPAGSGTVTCSTQYPVIAHEATGFIATVHASKRTPNGLSIVGVEALTRGTPGKGVNVALISVSGGKTVKPKTGSSSSTLSPSSGPTIGKYQAGSSSSGPTLGQYQGGTSSGTPAGTTGTTGTTDPSTSGTATSANASTSPNVAAPSASAVAGDQPARRSVPLKPVAPAIKNASTLTNATLSGSNVVITFPSKGSGYTYSVTSLEGVSVCSNISSLTCTVAASNFSNGVVEVFKVTAKSGSTTSTVGYTNVVTPSGSLLLANLPVSAAQYLVSALGTVSISGTLPIAGKPVSFSASYTNATNYSLSLSSGASISLGSVALTNPTMSIVNSNRTITFSLSGGASIAGTAVTISASGSSATSWTASGSISSLTIGGINLGRTALSVAVTNGAVGSFSLTSLVSVGSTAISIAGTYTAANTWSMAATVSAFSIGAVSLSGVSFSVSDANGAVTKTFGGSVSIASNQVSLSGTYSSANTWSLTATAASLTLGSAALTSAGVTVNDSAGSVSAIMTGMLSLGSTSVSLSGTYTNANTWTLTGTLASASFGGVSLSSLSATLADSTGNITGSLSATLALGSGTLNLQGSFSDANNWSVGVTGANLTLGSVTLNTASFTLTDTASVLSATLSGTLSVATTSVTVSGAYSSSTSWTLTASLASLSLGSVTLNAASVTVANVSGTISTRISGSFALGTGTLTVSGSYRNASNWSVTSTASNITLGSVVLGGAVATVADSSGSISVSIAGNLSLGTTTISATGTYTNANTWTLSATVSSVALGSLTLTSASLSLIDSGGGITGTLAATVQVANASINVSGTYTSASEWSVTATGAQLSLGSFTLSGATITISDHLGSISGTLNATFTIATTTLVISGTYTDSSNWSLTASPSTLSLGSLSLSNASVTVSDTYGTLTTALSGTLTVATATATVKGTYTSSSNWSLTASNISLTLGTVSLTQAKVTVSDSSNVVTTTMSGTISLGTTSLQVAGTYTDSRNWSLTASTSTFSLGSLSISGASVTITDAGASPVTSISGTVTIISTQVQLSGTFSDSNNWSLSARTLSIGLGGPTLNSASVTVASVAGKIATSIAGTVTFGSAASLTVVGTYTSSNNWSLSVTASAGSLTPLPGWTLSMTTFTGTIAGTASGIKWSLSMNAGTIHVGSDLTLTNVSVALGTQCTNIALPLCASSNGFYLNFAGSLTVALPGVGSFTANLVASMNTSQSAFEMIASIPTNINLVPGILTLSQASVAIGYNDPGFASIAADGVTIQGFSGQDSQGINIALTGNVTVSAFGSSLTVAMTVLVGTSGIVVVGIISGGLTISAVGATLYSVMYSTVNVTATAQYQDAQGSNVTLQVQLQPNYFFFAGALGAPGWLNTLLGTSLGSLPVYATVGSGGWSISAQIPESYQMHGGAGFGFAFQNMTLTVAQYGLQGISFTAAENGQMYVCGSLTDSCNASNAQNTINCQLAISFTAPGLIKFAITVRGAGPNDSVISNIFGTGINVTGLAFQVGLNLETTPIPIPELGLAATATLPTALLQDLGIAGSNTQPIPIQLVLNISDTDPCLDIQIGTKGSSQSIINIDNIITANYADLVFAPAGCTVGTFVIPEGIGFAFAGTFLGVNVSVQASITLSPFSLSADISVSGFTLGPFSTNGVSLCLVVGTPTTLPPCFANYPNLNTNGFAVAFQGNVQLAGNLSASVAGSFDASGDFTFNGSASLAIGSFSLQLTVAIAQVNGSFTASGSGSITIPDLLQVNVSGSFQSYANMSLSGSATFDPGGFNLATLNFSFTETNGAIALTANAGVSFGPFSGSITGAFSLNGTTIGYYFNANVAFSINGYDIAGGSLTVANCSNSTCTSGTQPTYAELGFSFLGADVSVSVDTGWSFSWDALGQALAQLGQAFLNEAVAIMGDLGAGIEDVANAIGSAFSVAASAVTDAINQVGQTISGWASDFAQGTAQVAADVMAGLNYAAGQVAGALNDVYRQAAQTAAQVLQAAGYVYDQIATGLQQGFDASIAVCGQALQAIGAGAQELVNDLSNAYSAVVSDVSQAIANVANTLGYALQDVANAIYNTFSSLGASAVNDILQAAGWAESAIEGAFSAIGGALADFGNSLVSALSDAWDTFTSWF